MIELDKLNPPHPRAEGLKSQLRLTLLDARTSSRAGFALAALPALFVFGAVVHYGFGLPVPGFGALESALMWLERKPYLSPLVLIGAPLLAFCLNALAVMHLRVDRARRELLLTLKLRAVNLTVMAVSAFIVAVVFVHVLSERAHHIR